jgi:hypothetical protein
MERGRQLQAGIVAEEELQLPARDTRGIRKSAKKEAKDTALGRKIREQSSPLSEVNNDENTTAGPEKADRDDTTKEKTP